MCATGDLERIRELFMHALRSGQTPDPADYARSVAANEREEFEADLRVAAFLFATHYSREASSASVRRAQDAIRAMRQLETRVDEGRARLSSSIADGPASPIERIAAALGIIADPASAQGVVRVFPRGDFSSVGNSKPLDRMMYLTSRKRGLQAADELVHEIGVRNVPVDLDRICQYLRLLVSCEPENTDVEGYMVTDGEVGGIVINSLIGDVRKHRFTLAHEIGHFVLHKTKRSYVIRDSADTLDTPGNSSDEIEANAFAGGLLIPSRLLGHSARAEEPSMASIQELAEDYDVSFCAAAHRLVSVSDWPCAFVLSKDGLTKWAAHSEHFAGYVRRNARLNPASAASSALGSADGATHDVILPESAWLDVESRDEVKEQSRNMGNGFVYTLLITSIKE